MEVAAVLGTLVVLASVLALGAAFTIVETLGRIAQP